MKFIKHLALTFSLSSVFTGSIYAQACGNGGSGGPSGPDGPGTGDPIKIYSGNEYRELDDLKVFGAVGEVPMTLSLIHI